MLFVHNVFIHLLTQMIQTKKTIKALIELIRISFEWLGTRKHENGA